MKRITIDEIVSKKKRKKKITALSTYDYPFAKLVDESLIDIVLVGDSVGMVCLGYETTLPVTMDDMIHHTKAVTRAAKRSLVVGDMPYGSYQDSSELAYWNARRFTREAGAQAVKLEGGERVIDQVTTLVQSGIPVMGHVGMTPQSIREFGGYHVQGRTKKEANQILKDAVMLEEAGAFSVVLECIPSTLATRITRKLRIPTIGIGAGVHVDGQILVLHDILGFESGKKLRFVRQYANLDREIRAAIQGFRNDVLQSKFPAPKEGYRG